MTLEMQCRFRCSILYYEMYLNILDAMVADWMPLGHGSMGSEPPIQ